jgi:hypothetical protein
MHKRAVFRAEEVLYGTEQSSVCTMIRMVW